MPIEFSCQSCQQRLSTPAGSAGQACQCPGCGAMLTVPNETVLNETVPSETRPVERGALKIPCPRCHYVLECAAALLGTKGQCRNCQHIFTITDRTAADAAESPLDEPTLVFHCPRCRQLFAGQAEMEGRKGKCHACGEVFAIALEPGPAKTAPASATGLSATASQDTASQDTASRITSGRSTTGSSAGKPAGKPAPTEKRPAAASVARPAGTPQPTPNTPQPASTPQPMTQVVISGSQSTMPIQFFCRHCAGTMEVPATAVGQQTNCPFCGSTLTIPARSETALGHSAGPTSMGSHSRYQASSVDRAESQPAWTELEDLSGAAHNNPYAASTSTPHDAASSPWNARPRRKRLRGLTFANAFELTLDSLFPFCLLAPLLLGMAALATYISYVLCIAAARSAVSTLKLSDPNSLWVLGLGVLISSYLIGCFLTTAAYCMTCNTALHAVRGKRVSSRVVFSTGEAYGGMLAIFLGWTIFNLVRKFGIGFLVREMSLNGDPQTAALVGGSIAAILAVAQLILTFLWGFVPYALLDGQSLSNAMETSMSICLNYFWTVIAVIICGWVLYLLVGILSIGLGLLVLAGFSFYMNAALYHLAED